jgi:hypothetical protein
MNRASSNGGPPRPLFGSIRLKDFDVTWAGPHPLQPGFCFGSEDGRLLFTDEHGVPVLGPAKGSDVGEAINGVAFSGEWMAVSTRASVVLGSVRQDKNRPANVGFPVGAHGIVASPGGYFVAPLGRTGVMAVKAGSGVGDPVGYLTSDKQDMYFYRVLALQGRNGADLLVCACRQGGIGITEVRWGEETYNMRVATFNGLDVVDVCAIRSDPESPAVAALGRDGTLILVRDGLNDKKPATIKFKTIKGTAYRVLSDGEHLFVVTSRGLYALTRLAGRLLSGMPAGEFTTQILVVPTDAVDASLVNGRWLLVITPDEVLNLDVRTSDLDSPGQHGRDVGEMEEDQPEILTPDWQVCGVSQRAQQMALTA